MQINHFKANIIILAKERKLTLTQIAKEAGYKSKQEFNNLFYRGFDRADVIAIADVFGVEPTRLLRKVSFKKYAKAIADPTKRVVENLKMICAEHEITKNELRKELGYTQPVFEKMFRMSNPRADIIENVCYYFDIDEEELTEPIDYERYGEAFIPRLSN